MPKCWADKAIMFSVIAVVAWSLIGLPIFDTFSRAWLTKDAAGFFTFVLVIVGAAQLGLFLWQLRLIRESLGDTKLAAVAAKAAADAAKIQGETAICQLRAYVYVENAYYEFAGTNCKVTFTIKNFGSTPAHRVRVSSIVQVVDWNDGAPTTPIPAPDDEQQWGSMAPNGDFVDSDADEVAFSISSHDDAVYLVGVISYETVFSQTRQTSHFRYYIGGDTSPELGVTKGEMSIDAEGNDST
jgi:hypothetical protein